MRVDVLFPSQMREKDLGDDGRKGGHKQKLKGYDSTAQVGSLLIIYQALLSC